VTPSPKKNYWVYMLECAGGFIAGQADPDYSVRMEPAEVVAAIRRIA
jgi:hypothetical protein